MTLLLLLGALAPGVAAAPPDADDPPRERPFAVIGAPLVSYDTNLGLGLGGFVQGVVVDRSGDQPYRAKVAAQLFRTSGGYTSHYLRTDVPAILRTPLRWQGEVRWTAWSRAPWYGYGNGTLVDADQDDAWYQWHKRRLNVQNSLLWSLTPHFEVFVTQHMRFVDVGVYEDSQLALDRPDGVDGGRFAWVALGVMSDHRDNEIEPREGYTWDISARVAHPWVGSQWTLGGINGEARLFASFGERLVSASFLMADATLGDRPFFDGAYVGGLGRGVIGGRWVFRGLPEERFHGDGLLAAQTELRWFFWQPMVRGAQLRFSAVPFVDVGRILAWDEPEDPWTHVHLTGGTGLRFNLRDLLVLRADVGVGREETLDGASPSVQVYILGDHPF